MMRVETLAPADGSYSTVLESEKGLLVDFMPYMFEPQKKDDLLFIHLAKSGVWGILALIASFAAPLSLIFYPRIGRLLRRQ